MAEKIAPGVIMESPPYPRGTDDDAARRHEEDLEKARFRRDSARATIVLGVAMMFLGSGLGWAFAAGGAAMTLGGTATAIFWGRRLRRLQEDPWDDPEIDAWEEKVLQDIDPGDDDEA